MYQIAGVNTVAGAFLAREMLPEVVGSGAGVRAAQAGLAVTGVAAGVYVTVALLLIVLGFCLRRWGSAEA